MQTGLSNELKELVKKPRRSRNRGAELSKENETKPINNSRENIDTEEKLVNKAYESDSNTETKSKRRGDKIKPASDG